MSSVRTRATPKPMSGKGIPPPPPFSPPSLPDTDNLLTVYSRNRSANSSRSVSPVSQVLQCQTDLVKDTPVNDRKHGQNNAHKQEIVDIKFTNVQSQKTQSEKQLVTPEMKIEPPTPPIEKKNDSKNKPKQEGKRNSNQEIVKSEQSDISLNKTPFTEKEVVQTQESYQHSQHNFDEPNGEEKKIQENVQLTEIEKESLYERFPLQEEKQVKQKLKRRVSKKGSIRKSQNAADITEDKMREDEKLKIQKDNETSNESMGEKTTRSKSQTRQKSLPESKNVTLHPDLPKTEIDFSEKKSPNSDIQIPEIKIKSQDALKGLYAADSDPKVEFTSDEGKVRMHRDKHAERIHEKESDILAKNVEDVHSDISNVIDPDDIVHEILGSCDQVNEILSRIMDDKNEPDNEDQDQECPAMDETKNKQLYATSEIIADQNIPGFEEAKLDLVENIADLTVDKVKEYLQIEEQANEHLRKELELTKEKRKKETINSIFKEKIEKNKTQEAKFVSQLNKDESLKSKSSGFLKDTPVSKSNKIPELPSIENIVHKENIQPPDRNKTQYASKKEHQIAKIKDFLKDPNSSKTEEVKLDVRLRKTDLEKDELSKEITKLADFLYIASYTALKEKDLSKDGITSVIEISDYPHLQSINDVLHIRQTDDNVALQNTFEQVADKVENTKKVGGKVLISCEESVGLAATLSASYFIKYEKLSTREAVKLVEKKRAQAKLHAGTILRLEEWEGKLQERKLSGGLSSMVASWLPMVFVIMLGYLMFKKIFERVDQDHMDEKRTDSDMYMKLYEYFDVRKWP